MAQQNKIIPLVFSVDDNYAACMAVTLKSLLLNASKDYFYKIYVLNTGLSQPVKDKLKEFENGEYFSVEYVNVEKRLSLFGDKLHLRDYYTNTTYYRFFIPTLFPQYDKVLYLDADLVVLDDISKMFNTELGDNLIGAIPEEVMQLVKVFGDYVEEGLDVECSKYFNAGIALFNTKALRELNVEQKFVDLLQKFTFEVTQDQDYLNVICKGRVVYLDLGWNKAPLPNPNFDDKDLKIIHFKLYDKPWYYKDVMYEEYFWEYAKKTAFYQDLLKTREEYYTPERVEKDKIAYQNLEQLARDYVKSPIRYKLFAKK